MRIYEATEQAYKNGYEAGKKDAVKWIPVTERLPESGETVLCLFPGEGCWVSTWDNTVSTSP